jgi:O-antigen biosynthesis protein
MVARSSKVLYPRLKSLDPVYDVWLQENFPRKAELTSIGETWRSFSYRPLISIVTPVYNPPISFLRQAIESVIDQVYPNWELCLADDNSPNPHVREVLQEYADRDRRIKYVFRKENGHISACSNSALELASGDFIALLDHDDLFTPDALYEAIRLLNQHPEADIIYSDEDKIDDQGNLTDPFFKPDWSPDSLLSRMYTCHLGIYRRNLVDVVGGFRLGYEGSQDYDLILRLSEKTENIFHIPKILYHWRIHTLSASSGGDAKPYAFEAAINALNSALVRRETAGHAQQVAPGLGAYTVRYQIHQATVSIVLFYTDSRSSLSVLKRALEAIDSRGAYQNLEVIIVDRNCWKDRDFSIVGNQLSNKNIDKIHYHQVAPDTTDASALNQATQVAQGDYLLFLRDFVEHITDDWIEALLEQAQRQSIGCSSGLLLSSNDTIWYAGTILHNDDVVRYPYRGVSVNHALGYFGQLVTVNNYSALSGDCLMCRRSKFEQVEGFTEAAEDFYDTDFCLKLAEKGLRHVLLPHVKLYHDRYPDCQVAFHSSIPNRQAGQVASPSGLAYMQNRWQNTIAKDSYYNRHLSYVNYYTPNVDNKHDVTERYEFNKLASELCETKTTLKDTEQGLKLLERRINQKNQELEQLNHALNVAHTRIAAMETSKFWQLRRSWFTFKKTVGLPTNE